ncbi:hypothetical protein OG241_43970 [Streptomyces sp. NBC_01390]|uniref:hypothetical protein n=1 Tax=Streptomyces sp. NBC_01390 TaxID=2903850 RepID=UPI00324A7632
MNLSAARLPVAAEAGNPAEPNLDYDLSFIPTGMWTEAVAPADSGTLLPGGQ